MALNSFRSSLRAPQCKQDLAILALARQIHSSTRTPDTFSAATSCRPTRRRRLHTSTQRRAADGLTAEQQAQLRNAFNNARSTGPNLGPFPRASMDRSPLSSNEARSMRELNFAQKIGRVGKRSGQWLFVGAGVGIATLVAYSTLSELFAKNSPTRLYEQAIEKLEHNAELRSILGDRLIFYGDHPSSRKRRQHRVQHTLTPDRNGSHIMTLSFWVEAKGEDIPWHIRARTWLRELVWEPSADHFLSNPTGTNIPTSARPADGKAPASAVSKEVSMPSWWSWLFGSFFASIGASWKGRLPPADKKPKRPAKPVLGEYTTGEVTAVLRQDSKGRFLFHSLVVDVPEKGRGNYRIWVQRPQVYTRR